MKNILSFKLYEAIDDSKKKIILEVIDDLKSISTFPVDPEMLKTLGVKLRDIKINPTDIDAAMYDSKKQKQYLIDGPSAPGGGGNGALKDLQALLNQ